MIFGASFAFTREICVIIMQEKNKKLFPKKQGVDPHLWENIFSLKWLWFDTGFFLLYYWNRENWALQRFIYAALARKEFPLKTVLLKKRLALFSFFTWVIPYGPNAPKWIQRLRVTMSNKWFLKRAESDLAMSNEEHRFAVDNQ